MLLSVKTESLQAVLVSPQKLIYQFNATYVRSEAVSEIAICFQMRDETKSLLYELFT